MAEAVTIITGAGGGIGLAVAERLAGAGQAVGLLDLDTARTEPTAARVRESGGAAWAGAVDVRDGDSIEAALDGATAALGPITGLVTAAGVIAKAPYLELTTEAWERTLGVNLTGTWLVMQRVARRMVAGGQAGAFVAISSVAGRGPRATAVDYAASKAGVISVVRSSAQALAGDGIRVNAVCPGVVDTPMTDAIHEQTSRELGITREESVARMVAAIPLGRIETTDDVAAAVEYLLSDGAGYVTGQALNVCGGLEFD
jgi:NAD(P)-dependent dehydrogenase (short-subunit alcohol dehydrogenase family)